MNQREKEELERMLEANEKVRQDNYYLSMNLPLPYTPDELYPSHTNRRGRCNEK